MDLIYIILSVLLRLSPAVRKISKASSSNRGPTSRNRKSELLDLAFWVPLVGWISVSVQNVPHARWLRWRVRSVQAFGGRPLNFERNQRWSIESLQQGGRVPPGEKKIR